MSFEAAPSPRTVKSKPVNKVGTVALKRIASSLVLVIALSSLADAESEPELTGQALVEILRAGGHNIYFRHAQTDWSQGDQINAAGDWSSCDSSRMRQLSDEGRQTSKAIGDAIRLLEIPISRVLSSPYCRTIQTAALLELGPVETTTDIMNLRAAAYFGGRGAILRRARIRLSNVPPSGTNTVLVGHGNVAREATPIYPDEAEAAIFRPDGNGNFVFVGRLKPEQWKDLAVILAH